MAPKDRRKYAVTLSYEHWKAVCAVLDTAAKIMTDPAQRTLVHTIYNEISNQTGLQVEAVDFGKDPQE